MRSLTAFVPPLVLHLLLPLLHSAVTEAQAPWHVSIFRIRDDGDGSVFLCGGSIISPTLVISAAHCFWDNAEEKFRPSHNLQVAAREIDERHKVQIRNVSTIDVPERFVDAADSYRGDIALLKLAQRFDYTPFVQSVDVDFTSTSSASIGGDQLGSVVGGVGGGGRRVGDPVEVPTGLRTLSHADCERKLHELVGIGTSIRLADDKFCFADNDRNGSWYVGTSGNGFVVRRDERNLLLGVVSLNLTPTRQSRVQLIGLTNVHLYENLIKKPMEDEFGQVENRTEPLLIDTRMFIQNF